MALYHARMPQLPPEMPELLLPVPPEEPDQDHSPVPHEPSRPNVVALATLIVGFGVALAAQYLPWASQTLGGLGAPVEDGEDAAVATRTAQVPLAYLNAAHVMAYLFTLAFALAAVAVAVFATVPARRIATGAAAGLLAANVTVLVGFQGLIGHLGAGGLAGLAVPNPNVSAGPGYLLAYAAVLVLAVAVVAATRAPALRGRLIRPRRPADEPAGSEPLELTVTSVPPILQ